MSRGVDGKVDVARIDLLMGRKGPFMAGRTSLDTPKSSYSRVQYGPDGRTLAWKGSVGRLLVWNADGKKLHDWMLPGSVPSLAYSPDGRHLITGTDKGTACILRLAGPPSPFDALRRDAIPAEVWKQIGVDPAKAPEELVGVFGTIKPGNGILSLNVSPDGRRLFATTSDGVFRAWDTTTGKDLPDLSRNLYVTRDSPNLKIALSGDGTRAGWGNVRSQGCTVWESGTGRTLRNFGQGKGVIGCLALNPSGTRVALGFANTVDVWDAIRGRGLPEVKLEGHTKPVVRVVYSPDGKRLATASDDKTVRVWDAATGKELLSMPTPPKAILNQQGLTFSPDSNQLAFLTTSQLRVWNAATGAAIFQQNMGQALALCYSPDEAWLATGHSGGGGEVVLWEASSGQKGREWVLPVGVRNVTFAPDGRHLLTGNEDGSVYVLRLPAPPGQKP